jgi:hypothetical protein
MFVNKEAVRVSLEENNDEADAIFIKPKMDFGTKQKVMSAAFQISSGGAGIEVSKGMNLDIQFGAIQTALLIHNIVKWSGPSFKDVPCKPENIQRLDPDEPLVEKVLRELDQRNKGKQSPDPK